MYLDRGIIPGTTVEINAFISSTTHTSSPDSLLGLLQSSFIAGLSVGSPCFGHAVHTYKPFLLLSVGLGVWTAALLTAALAAPAQSFAMLLFGRMLSGVGEAAFVAIAFPFLAGYAEKREKTSHGVLYRGRNQPQRPNSHKGGATTEEEEQGRESTQPRLARDSATTLERDERQSGTSRDGKSISACCGSSSVSNRRCEGISPLSKKEKEVVLKPTASPPSSTSSPRSMCLAGSSSSSSSSCSSCVVLPSPRGPPGSRIPPSGSSRLPPAFSRTAVCPSVSVSFPPSGEAEQAGACVDPRELLVRIDGEEEGQEGRKSSSLQGRLLGVFLCMLPLGVASGIAYGATAARLTALGWPVAYALLACVGFILSVTACCLFRDCTDDPVSSSSSACPPRHQLAASSPTPRSGVAPRGRAAVVERPEDGEEERQGQANFASSISAVVKEEKEGEEAKKENDRKRESMKELLAKKPSPPSLLEARGTDAGESETRYTPRLLAPLSLHTPVEAAPSLSTRERVSASPAASEDCHPSSSLESPLSLPLLEKAKKKQQTNSDGEGTTRNGALSGIADHSRPSLPSSLTSAAPAPSLWAETCVLVSSRPFLFLCAAAASYAAVCQALATFAANFLLGLGLFETELHAGLATGIVAASAGLAGLCFSECSRSPGVIAVCLRSPAVVRMLLQKHTRMGSVLSSPSYGGL